MRRNVPGHELSVRRSRLPGDRNQRQDPASQQGADPASVLGPGLCVVVHWRSRSSCPGQIDPFAKSCCPLIGLEAPGPRTHQLPLHVPKRPCVFLATTFTPRRPAGILNLQKKPAVDGQVAAIPVLLFPSNFGQENKRSEYSRKRPAGILHGSSVETTSHGAKI